MRTFLFPRRLVCDGDVANNVATGGKEGDEQFEDYVDTIESLGTTVNEVRCAHQTTYSASCKMIDRQ